MRRRELIAALALGAGLPGSWARGAADEGLLAQLLRAAGPVSTQVLAHTDEFEPQVLWTRLARDATGSWQPVAQHQFGIQRERWFAAASFIKLPLVALLAEALTRLGLVEGLPQLQLQLASASACAPLPPGNHATWPLLRLLRAMLVVSDNASYNALYELLGSDVIHARLAQLGYGDCRIGARLGCARDVGPGKLEARLSDADGHLLWHSAAQSVELPQRFPFGSARKGRAWMQNGRQIAGAHDFSRSNFMPLADVHRMILELGSAQPAAQSAFDIDPGLRQHIARIMCMTPRQCPDPHYPPEHYADDHGKWLIAADASGQLPSQLSIASKNAQSFGFLGDSAFIVDRSIDRAFALSAVVYVDRDGVLNDGNYAYAQIGRPFLRELGMAIWAYERSQPPLRSSAGNAG
jgi:hypothetical protein